MRIFIAVILVFSFTFNVNSIEIEKISIYDETSDVVLGLMDIENIEATKTRFINGIEGKNYRLISKSIRKDGDIEIDTLFDSENPYTDGSLSKDSLIITMVAKKKLDTATFSFNLERVKIIREFRVIENNKNDYSLRHCNILNKNFEVGEMAKLALYTLPYQDPKFPEIYHYCRLEADGIPPEKWPEEYGVEHIIIFYIEFY